MNQKTEQAKGRVGSKVGMLTLTEWLGSDKYRRAVFRCRCDCGGEVVKSSLALTKSNPNCGCDSKRRQGPLRHGAARRGSSTPEYETWRGMKARCYNPRHKAFSYYGGRGVRVCERWLQFENFLADMGPRPGPGYSIDRVDSRLGYEPGNCRWIPHGENASKARSDSRSNERRALISKDDGLAAVRAGRVLALGAAQRPVDR